MEKPRKLPIITETDQLSFAIVDSNKWLVVKQKAPMKDQIRVLVISSPKQARIMAKLFLAWADEVERNVPR